MATQVLTDWFATYKAQCEADQLPIVFDRMIFALNPGQDYQVAIEPSEPIPQPENIVFEYDIPEYNSAFLNPDAVVYSAFLDTHVGTWNYNAVYLINSEHQKPGVIVHLPQQTKTATSGPVQGDSITRNIVTTYRDAKILTQIEVRAEVWQLDFINRLESIDERQRLNNISHFGRALFFGDGFLVNHSSGKVTYEAGIAYVGGLRCYQQEQTEIDISSVTLPIKAWLVCTFEGEPQSSWNVRFFIELSNDDIYYRREINGQYYYAAPIANIKPSAADDLRNTGVVDDPNGGGEIIDGGGGDGGNMVPKDTQIITKSPLRGGHDLSTDVTLSVDSATTSRQGTTKLTNQWQGSSQVLAVTQKGVNDAVNWVLSNLPEPEPEQPELEWEVLEKHALGGHPPSGGTSNYIWHDAQAGVFTINTNGYTIGLTLYFTDNIDLWADPPQNREGEVLLNGVPVRCRPKGDDTHSVDAQKESSISFELAGYSRTEGYFLDVYRCKNYNSRGIFRNWLYTKHVQPLLTQYALKSTLKKQNKEELDALIERAQKLARMIDEKYPERRPESDIEALEADLQKYERQPVTIEQKKEKGE